MFLKKAQHVPFLENLQLFLTEVKSVPNVSFEIYGITVLLEYLTF